MSGNPGLDSEIDKRLPGRSVLISRSVILLLLMRLIYKFLVLALGMFHVELI